jgi:hypothetical protein
MSFYVVSISRIQESTLGTLCSLRYCYQAFSDEIRNAPERQIPKTDLGLSTKIMTLCGVICWRKESAHMPQQAQLKT